MSLSRDGRPCLGASVLLALVLAACGGDAPPDSGGTPTLTREELLDPETCSSCHPRHYREWKSSMHAYASKDPVFIAMNQRAQREAQVGDFCVGCHAPMAVREGETTDGLNLATVPDHLQGVTCYFCHNAVSIEDNHNAKLSLANDTTMRSGVKDPVASPAHGVEYSELHDRNNLKSSELCGSCHDVVTPAGVHLERTLAEYKQTPFGRPGTVFDETCQGCHMDNSKDKAPIAVVQGMNLPARTLHEHLWPAVDVALTDDFPDQEMYRTAVECALMEGTKMYEFSANALGNEFTLVLETTAGHAQPSGAAQDRRMWVELIAYDGDDNVIEEIGTIGDQDIEQVPEGEPGYEPRLTMLRDHIYDATGHEVHMFWDAAPSAMYPDGYVPNVLPLGTDFGQHVREVKITLGVVPERVEVRMRMRPVGMDILRDLVASEDLEEDVLAKMPTFTVHSVALEWIRSIDLNEPIRAPKPAPINCKADYLCHFDPAGCPPK